MSTRLSNTLFQKIAKSTSNHNPTWSILFANEYLAKENPLRLALGRKALQQKTTSMNVQQKNILLKAVSGEKFSNLSFAEKRLIKESNSTLATSKGKTIPTPKRRHSGRKEVFMKLYKAS